MSFRRQRMQRSAQREAIGSAQRSTEVSNMRLFLRFGGFVLVTVGLVFAIIGFVSFFGSMNHKQSPQYFWCAFVGLPMIVFGSNMLKAGFLGVAANYVSDELSQPISNTARTIAQAVKESPGTARSPSRTIEQRLEKLDRLFDKGMITDVEYREQRDKIIAEI